MKVEITGTAEEIAALVLELQRRQGDRKPVPHEHGEDAS